VRGTSSGQVRNKHVLFIRKYVASATHVRSLIDNFDRALHRLSKQDLDKVDKMNFDSSRKICAERVTDLLQQVAGSKGTVIYLECMRYLMEGCLNTSLSISEKKYTNCGMVHFF